MPNTVGPLSQINIALERIAQILMTVTVDELPNPNILGANPYQPDDVSSAQVPFWVLELDPQGGQSDLPISDGQQRRGWVTDALLCVQRREAGSNLKYNVRNTAQWVDAVYHTMSQHVRLSAPPIRIVSASNSSPVTVVTNIASSYETGDQVSIAGVEDNTAVNGNWNLTVVDWRTFTVPAIGNGAGVKTGTVQKTQPFDLGNILDCWIGSWAIVDYEYGSTSYIALLFKIIVREFYITAIAQ